MQDWFIWNGTRCTDYGIHVSQQPPLTIPKLRSSQVCEKSDTVGLLLLFAVNDQ